MKLILIKDNVEKEFEVGSELDDFHFAIENEKETAYFMVMKQTEDTLKIMVV